MKQNKKIKITESKLKDMIREAINELAPETYYSAEKKAYDASRHYNGIGDEDKSDYYSRKTDGLRDNAYRIYNQISSARKSYLKLKADYDNTNYYDEEERKAKEKEMDNAYRRYNNLKHKGIDLDDRFVNIDNGTRVYNKDTHQWEDKPTTKSLGESKLRKMIREAINELAPETYLSAAKKSAENSLKNKGENKLQRAEKDFDDDRSNNFYRASKKAAHVKDGDDGYKNFKEDPNEKTFRKYHNEKNREDKFRNMQSGIESGKRVYNKNTHRWEDKPTTESLGESKLRNYIKNVVKESIKNRR